MRFHIVTPVLNGARHLAACIESVRAQTWSDWRLTVRDGGSDDGSVEIAQRYAEQDPRVTVVSGPDGGQYDAIRAGLDAADGGVLAWLNADDLYTPWAFQTVAAHMADGSHRWVTGLPAHWDDAGRLVAVSPVGVFHRRLIANGWYNDDMLGCIQQESTFFAKDLWLGLTAMQKRQFADLDFAGDFYLWTQFAQTASLQVVSSVLSGFRVHGGNRSRLEGARYRDEVRACGGKAPPPPVARAARRVFDWANSVAALKNFRRAAFALDRAAGSGR